MATVPVDLDPATALLDVKAVARLLGCSQRHVYRLSDADAMPRPLKLGSLVRWNREALEAWLAAGCPRPDGVRRAGK